MGVLTFIYNLLKSKREKHSLESKNTPQRVFWRIIINKLSNLYTFCWRGGGGPIMNFCYRPCDIVLVCLKDFRKPRLIFCFWSISYVMRRAGSEKIIDAPISYLNRSHWIQNILCGETINWIRNKIQFLAWLVCVLYQLLSISIGHTWYFFHI